MILETKGQVCMFQELERRQSREKKQDTSFYGKLHASSPESLELSARKRKDARQVSCAGMWTSQPSVLSA